MYLQQQCRISTILDLSWTSTFRDTSWEHFLKMLQLAFPAFWKLNILHNQNVLFLLWIKQVLPVISAIIIFICTGKLGEYFSTCIMTQSCLCWLIATAMCENSTKLHLEGMNCVHLLHYVVYISWSVYVLRKYCGRKIQVNPAIPTIKVEHSNYAKCFNFQNAEKPATFSEPFFTKYLIRKGWCSVWLKFCILYLNI